MKELSITKPRSTEAVHTHTHTIDLVNNKIIIMKKDNIILSCGYYDTG